MRTLLIVGGFAAAMLGTQVHYNLTHSHWQSLYVLTGDMGTHKTSPHKQLHEFKLPPIGPIIREIERDWPFMNELDYCKKYGRFRDTYCI